MNYEAIAVNMIALVEKEHKYLDDSNIISESRDASIENQCLLFHSI